MKTSKRNRNRGRTIETYQNKLSKITIRYNHLFYQSKNNKEVYLLVPEQDRTPKGKIFFFEKFPTLQKFLEVNKLRTVSNK